MGHANPVHDFVGSLQGIDTQKADTYSDAMQLCMERGGGKTKVPV